MAQSETVTITVDETRRVSGLLQVPRGARICYVLAHGAGAGMSHPFMAAIADGLAQRGIATMRYQFPYMEQRSKRPDAQNLPLGRRSRSRSRHCRDQLGWQPRRFAGPFAMGRSKDQTGSYAGGLLLAALGIIALGIVLMLGCDERPGKLMSAAAE